MQKAKGKYFRPVINPKIRDGLFKEVLRRKDSVSQLYELLYDETLSVKDIEIQTLDSTILYRARYNDISFLASDGTLTELPENSVSFAINEDASSNKVLLVLVEHQSTKDPEINSRIKEYADDFIELYNKDKLEMGEKIPIDINIKGAVLYNGRNLNEQINNEGRLFEFENFENTTGIEIEHVDARYAALISRFGEHKDFDLFKLAYFFQEFDKELNRLDKEFNIKEVTELNADNFDEAQDELIKQKKAEIGMIAYMNARQKCKETNMLINELKGIKALITESEKERVTMPENFWEGIEREAELKAEKNRKTEEKLAGAEEKLAGAEEKLAGAERNAAKKVTDILGSKSSKEIKEMRLNDLRDTVEDTIGAIRFESILKEITANFANSAHTL